MWLNRRADGTAALLANHRYIAKRSGSLVDAGGKSRGGRRRAGGFERDDRPVSTSLAVSNGSGGPTR
jgi:hypothetical protein